MFLEKWNGADSLELHSLQLAILLRGLQLLQIGGQLVYSTCSMNPVENEAVVAEALRIAGATMSISLLPTHDLLPAFKRRHGLLSWPVLDAAGVIHSTKPCDYDKLSSRSLVPSMFAPANARQLRLQRCMRVYPHLQDTGGFFVALFCKREYTGDVLAPPLPVPPCLTPVLNLKAASIAAVASSKKSKKAAKKHFRSEDAWCFVPQGIWAPVVKSFGLSNCELQEGQLFTRQAEMGAASVKKIYCCSVGCSTFLKRGCSAIYEDCVDSIGDYMRRLRVLSCGMLLFERIGRNDAAYLLCPCPAALIALQPSLLDSARPSRRFIWLRGESWKTLIQTKRLHFESVSHAEESRVLRKLFKYA